MPRDAASFTLAFLDQPAPLTLDPAIRDRNIVALRAHDAALADALGDIKLPADWRPVTALDDSPTFQLGPPEAPQWWQGSALPRDRATALIRNFKAGTGNITLPGSGTGAELLRLLECFPAHVAAFVFEPELTNLAALLHLHDLSARIAQRRCFFFTGPDHRGALQALLTKEVGLLPPGNILRLPGTDDAWLATVQTTCELAHRFVAEQREPVLRTLAPEPPAADTPRRAIAAISFTTDARLRAAVTAFGAARDTDEQQSTASVLGDPTEAHLLIHAQRLAAARPDRILCADLRPAALPTAFRPLAAEWHLSHAAAPPEPDTAIHYAATPRIQQRLTTAGLTDVRPLWFAADERLPAGRFDPAGPVVLLGDLPDASAEACGIEQPTHRQLWHQAGQVLRKHWQEPRAAQPEAILRQAEHATGLAIRDPATRPNFVRLIGFVLSPAILWEQLLATFLIRCEVSAIGRGWHRLAEPVPVWGEHLSLDQINPEAGVRLAVALSQPDPLTVDLVNAAALGWPILLHAASLEVGRDLGGVLVPGQHLLAASAAKDIRALASDPQKTARLEQIATTAATRVRTHHTWRNRLADLAAGSP
jgi:hypothetical protein